MSEPDDARKSGNTTPGVRWARRRLPFDEGDRRMRSAFRRAGTLFYAVAAASFAGFALYMSLVERHPLTSAYVMAPAVGAVWFVLRFVMMMGPRNQGRG